MDEMLKKHRIKEMKKILFTLAICTALTVIVFAAINVHSLFRHNPYAEDFDFLAYHLRESFPFFGVAERRLGIDLDEWLIGASQNVADSYTDLAFLARLTELDRRLGHMAHFRIWPADVHPSFLQHVHYVGHDLNPPPSAIAPISPGRRTVLTSIVEEGRIARVTFLAFDQITLPYEERNHLIEFLGEVRDYEHLVIDIRHVGGGLLFDQVELLIRPNITERIEFYSFGFTMKLSRLKKRKKPPPTHENFS